MDLKTKFKKIRELLIKSKEFDSYEEVNDAIKQHMKDANFQAPTKHPKEALAGMPQEKNRTKTGFKLKVAKQEEIVKFDELGQWSINKSNYGPKDMELYDSNKNVNRKASRTGETVEGIGQNKGVRQYTTSSASVESNRAANEVKAQNKKAKSSLKSFKDMSPEKQAKLKEQYETTAKAESIAKPVNSGSWATGRKGNINHPVHGSVKIESTGGKFRVRHNGAEISSHEFKDEAVSSLKNHMIGLDKNPNNIQIIRGDKK